MMRKAIWTLSVSVLGLAAAPAWSQPATATPVASAEPGQAADIVVNGVRASIKSAQAIKRNSDQVVDSIVAEDIGKFPDNTVSDSLQRVTGVQVSRGGGEAQTVLIRGLPNVQSYINGREVFTGTFRGVALQDIPAELVAGIDVYKTASPELVEGGVGGLIDIRMRRPFDFGPGLTVAGGGRVLYGDQSTKTSYVASGVISTKRDVGDGGQFGVLLGGSYNKRQYLDETAFNFNYAPRFNNTGGAGQGAFYTNPSSGRLLLFPQTTGVLYNAGDRERTAFNSSIQYSPHNGTEYWLDALYTGYREKFDVNFFIGLPGQAEAPLGAYTVAPGTDIVQSLTNLFNFTINSKQAFVRKTDTYQIAGGAKWALGGDATLATQVVYNNSKVASQQVVVDIGYVVPQLDYNLNRNGTPFLNLNATNPATPNGPGLITLFDNRNLATSRQIAWHVDLKKELGDGFFQEFKMGTRFTDRKGQSDGTNPSGYGIPFVLASTLPADFLALSPDNAVYGRAGIGSFAVPSSSFILNNTARIRALAGRPPSDPPFDANRSFVLNEKTYATYAQLKFGTIGGSLDGVFGARLVNTAARLQARSSINGIVSPIDRKQNYVDVLPSLSLRWRIAPDVQLRFVAGKSITRQEFDQLNPATSLTQAGNTLQGTGNGGNADLRPIKSDNLDATAEWYFSRTGSLTIAGFYRKLDGYVQFFTAPEVLPGLNGTPTTFQVTRPRNTNGELKGVDIAFTQFADFAPGFLSGFGVQANYTYTDGTALNPFVGSDAPITGLSKHSFNLVGIYEKYGLSARLAYNWRGKSIASYRAPDAVSGNVTVHPIGFLDFSASYAINQAVSITFDATNLTKTIYRDDFLAGVAPRDTRTYERTYSGGLRFKF